MTFTPWTSITVAIAGWMNRQQQVIEYLREENRILREKLGQERILLDDSQKRRLAVPAMKLGGDLLRRWGMLFSPDTLLGWRRWLITGKCDAVATSAKNMTSRCQAVGCTVRWATAPVIFQAVGVALLAGMVISGTPGGGITGKVLIMTLFNRPPEALPIMNAIGQLVDAPATLVNSVGDTAASMMVSRLLGGRNWIRRSS